MTFSDDEVASWAAVVMPLRDSAVHGDERAVSEAAANYCSGAALYFHLPQEVAELVEAAFEIGYAQALRDVRDESVDGLGPVDPDGDA